MYKLNTKILKGFAFQINIRLTDGDIDEIFGKMLTKYSSRMKKITNKKLNLTECKINLLVISTQKK